MSGKSETTAREVITRTLRNSELTGESPEMKARWIVETLAKEGYLIIKPTWTVAPDASPSREAPEGYTIA